MDQIIKSETVTVERAGRYLLSAAIGLLGGVFFVSVTRLLIHGAALVMNYVRQP